MAYFSFLPRVLSAWAGMTDAVNPLCAGTKCGAHYRLEVAAGAKTSVYWKIESCLHTQSMELPELRNLFTNKRKAVQAYYNNVSAWG